MWPTSAWSPPYVKYKLRYVWFCKRKFADCYQKMDEKKLKNWNCIENGYKSSSSHSESFWLLPSWLAVHCSSLSTHFSSIVLQNSTSGIRVKLLWILWTTYLSLSKNWLLWSHFKIGNNQKSQRVRFGLYAGCTITSACRCSHSWTKWAVCGCALLWWSIYYPTSSGRFHLICCNSFSNTDT